MVELPRFVFIVLLLICLGSQGKSDGSNHRYSKGDIVPFYANKVGPYSNPQETYAYYDLPYCSPDSPEKKRLNLGEMLNGDRLVSTPYNLEFLVDKDYTCNKTLTKTDVSRFRNVIEKDYFMEFYCDDLPLWAFVGEIYSEYPDHGMKKHILHKHFEFQVSYNKDRVIRVNLTTSLGTLADMTEDKELNVGFTYIVRWKETLETFDDRMEIYVDSSFLPRHTSVHSHSITFSSLVILVLISCLLTFYMLVLRKDISMYDVEGDLTRDNQEDAGWKNIHGDVFRFPQHKSLFSAAIGSGTQLLLLILSILVLGLLGVFRPYHRGVFWNALVIVYVVTSAVSGYTSVSFYSQLEGTKWMKNLLLTGGLFCLPLVLTFGFLSTVAVFYGTTAALPLEAIVILSLLWIFLVSPLHLLGGIVAKNRTPNFQTPCRTAKCRRDIPKLRWYMGVLPQMMLAGILPFSVIYIQIYYVFASVWGYHVYALYSVLFVVFVLLLIVTALVSVARTYFQLAVENHEWWWRSFFCGGSTGLFMYVYCIWYYFERSNMSGFMQTSFFFGYMACVCYGIFLALGTVGFCASLLFVRYLYASIKCD